MWKATATQHAEPAVYEVLGAISSNLSPEHQNYLLQLIHSIPFAEYSPRTINLIAQFQNTYSSYPSSTEIKVRAPGKAPTTSGVGIGLTPGIAIVVIASCAP